MEDFVRLRRKECHGEGTFYVFATLGVYAEFGRRDESADVVALIGLEEMHSEAVPSWVRTAVTGILSMSNSKKAKLEIYAVVWDPGCPRDA